MGLYNIYIRIQDLTFHLNLETVCMKCQTLFSGTNPKKYFTISSVDFFFR